MSIQDFILLVVAIGGFFIGLAGWFSNRNDHITDDARWKGTVDQNFKDIKEGVSGIGERMSRVEGAVATLNTQNALHTTKLKEHDSQIKEHDDQIQEIRQILAEQEHTA